MTDALTPETPASLNCEMCDSEITPQNAELRKGFHARYNRKLKIVCLGVCLIVGATVLVNLLGKTLSWAWLPPSVFVVLVVGINLALYALNELSIRLFLHKPHSAPALSHIAACPICGSQTTGENTRLWIKFRQTLKIWQVIFLIGEILLLPALAAWLSSRVFELTESEAFWLLLVSATGILLLMVAYVAMLAGFVICKHRWDRCVSTTENPRQ